MKKHLVLVGGGHAHMVTLANLHMFIEKEYLVTVIQPSSYHYYSGMGPGMLGRVYAPNEIRFDTRQTVERKGGTFVKGYVKFINPQSKTLSIDSGDIIRYDVVSFNAGSYVPQDIVSERDSDIFTVKPIETLIQAQSRLLELMYPKRINVAIIGGGAASAEIAGNVWRLAHDHAKYMPQIKIFAGRRLMARFPDSVRGKALISLKKREIQVLENTYVRSIRKGHIEVHTGHIFSVDFVFLASGVKPSAIFAASGLPVGPDGGLRVNSYLQCPEYPNIFGGGDCIYYEPSPLDKVGVYAVRQNSVIYHNLMAYLEGSPLQRFDPGGDYLLIINMGDGTGILRKKGFELDGRLAFWIKDFIDRRFMKRFQ